MLSPDISTLVAAPVVDIDGTLFVQGGLFLLLMLVLWPLLFKPWLAAQERRTEAIQGALVKSKDVRRNADALLVELDTKLDAARDRANDLRAKVRHDEEGVQAQALAETRAAAMTRADEARKTIAAQAETARAALATKVDELAQDIVTRLLGRTP